MAWFTVTGGLGGGAAVEVVDFAIFFFAKKTKDRDHFLPCGAKGRSTKPRAKLLVFEVKASLVVYPGSTISVIVCETATPIA